MKHTAIAFVCCLFFMFSFSQVNRVDQIYKKLVAIDKNVVDADCDKNFGMIVSYPGLNQFFAGKIGSYLSNGEDLSLSKNYATLNSADGILSLNHNFKPKLEDGSGWISRFLTLGIKANVKSGYAAVFSKERFNDELGISVKHTWFGKGTMWFDKCKQQLGVDESQFIPSTQKKFMNKERAKIVEILRVEMLKEALLFETSVAHLQKNLLPDETLKSVQKDLRDEFYKALENTYIKKYAEAEAKALDENPESYNRVTTSWTSLYAYIPVTRKTYQVAPSFAQNFSDEHMYAWELSLTHTRIVEYQRAGRFFFKVGGNIVMNNGIKTDLFDKVDIGTYKNMGGVDTVKLGQLETTESYIGEYKNFISPGLQLQAIWFPNKSIVGFSLYLEKFFGDYDPFNGKFGIPIKFNDKDGKPTVTFELQARFSDMTDAIQPNKTFSDKASYGISVGLPFSSILN